MQNIRVVARIIAMEGKAETVKQALLALIAPTRQEEGCLVYTLLQDSERPYEFVVLEEWSSQEAFANHLSSPHFNQATDTLANLLADTPSIRTYVTLA